MLQIKARVTYKDYGGRVHIKEYSITAANVRDFYQVLEEYIENDETRNSWDFISTELTGKVENEEAKASQSR
jgi:hypothetical protein